MEEFAFKSPGNYVDSTISLKRISPTEKDKDLYFFCSESFSKFELLR